MLRRFHIGTLAAVGLLVAGAAFAAGRSPAPMSLGNQPVISIGDVQAQSTCRLGVTGTPISAVDWLLPPNDNYYTLVRAADCTACDGPGGVEATIAHVTLQMLEAGCSANVSVSIVGATGTPACRVPDPTTTICPPTTYTLTAPTAGVFDFSLPVPAGCCFSGDAFLAVTVNSVSCGPGVVNLVTNGAVAGDCVACTSYNNTFPPAIEDLCPLFFPGNPLMNLEVDCCNAVGTTKASWGSLKIRYRD